MSVRRRAWVGVCLISALVLESRAADIYVSPLGNDAWDGSAEKPLATLEAARDAVRDFRDKAVGDIVVELAAGEYLLTETLVFGPKDSAVGERRIVYRAAPGAMPVLTSAVAVKGWVPSPLRPGVWEASLDPFAKFLKAKPHLSVLYRGDERLPRSRSTGFHPDGRLRREHGMIRNVDRVNKLNSRTMCFPQGAMTAYRNLADVELLIRPTKKWLVNFLPLASVDVEHLTAHTEVPGTYALECIEYGGVAKAGAESVWVEGAVEHLDEEGSWAVDTQARKLYLVSKTMPENIRMPVLCELVRVEGIVSEKDDGLPVRNLSFEGLVFTGTDRMRWHRELVGIQHDWDFYDVPNAALRFRGVEGCTVKGCHFVQTGENGVRFDLFARDNTVEGCRFEDLGGGGVLLVGYGPGRKDLNNGNRVAGNFFTRCGQILWHSPAIHIWQSGSNRIENNRIVDMPYNGIVLSGVRARFFLQLPKDKRLFRVRDGDEEDLTGRRELVPTIRAAEVGTPRNYGDIIPLLHCRNNIVRANEISDCVRVLEDGNGIYLSAVGSGNLVEENLVYNIHGAAIRADDDTFGVMFRRNILFGRIRIKHINSAENNLIYLYSDVGTEALVFDNHPEQIDVVPEFAATIRHNICVLPAFQKRAGLQPISARTSSMGEYCVDVKQNLYWYVGDPKRSQEFLVSWRKQWPADVSSVAADPLFINESKLDFRLKEGSPALALGFIPFEMTHIGLPGDPGWPRMQRFGFPPRKSSRIEELKANGIPLTIDLSK